jgi:signal peptidase
VLLATAVVGPLAAVLVTAWATGHTLAGVRSESMAPGIPRGALVVVEPVAPSAIAVGDVISYRDERRDERVVTHRVIEVVERSNGLFLRTQGDANMHPDLGHVAAGDVVGRVRFRIVRLGSLADAARSGRVQLAFAAVPAATWGLSELLGARARRRQRAEREEIRRLEAEVAALQARLAASSGDGGRPVRSDVSIVV